LDVGIRDLNRTTGSISRAPRQRTSRPGSGPRNLGKSLIVFDHARYLEMALVKNYLKDSELQMETPPIRQRPAAVAAA